MHRLALAAVMAVGCASADKPDDSTPPATTEPFELHYQATWDGVQAMLDEHCAACHHEVGAAADTPFPDVIEADLVAGSGAYVVPGSPAESTLWRVLEGTLDPGDFGVMPDGTGPLPLERTGHVELWIEAGAPHPFGG